MARRRHLESATASICLLISALCLFGYLFSANISIRYAKDASSSGFEMTLGVDDGQIGGWAATMPPSTEFGFRLDETFFRKRASFRNSLWGVTCERIQWSSSSSFALFVPLWCVWLPCLILPSLWFRQWWRKQPHVRGFDVEQPKTTATDAGPDPTPLSHKRLG